MTWRDGRRGEDWSLHPEELLLELEEPLEHELLCRELEDGERKMSQKNEVVLMWSSAHTFLSPGCCSGIDPKIQSVVYTASLKAFFNNYFTLARKYCSQIHTNMFSPDWTFL